MEKSKNAEILIDLLLQYAENLNIHNFIYAENLKIYLSNFFSFIKN